MTDRVRRVAGMIEHLYKTGQLDDAPIEPEVLAGNPLAQAPQGAPIIFGYSAEPPYATFVALSNLYRSIVTLPHYPDYEAIKRAEETHLLIRTYIQASYYMPLRARGGAQNRLERYPPLRGALRRIKRAVQKNDEEAFHRAWLAVSFGVRSS